MEIWRNKTVKTIFIIILLFTLICIPSQVTSNRMDSNKYAVIIGNDARYYSWMVASGSGCAKLLNQILRDAGFSQKNIKMLVNHKASPGNIEDALIWLQQVAMPDSEVVFAFFGHGCPSAVQIYKAGLMHWTIGDLLAPVESEKQLIIIDSCGSAGAILEGSDGVSLCTPNRIVVTSTKYEIESSVQSGKYTYWSRDFLLEGIKEGLADFNADGLVSVQEAYQYGWSDSFCGGLMCDNYGQDFFL